MQRKEICKDLRWQKKRLEIFKRDNWKCVVCGEKTKILQIHHTTYSNNRRNKWVYPVTMCEKCHEQEHLDIEDPISHLVFLLEKYGFLKSDIAQIIDKILSGEIAPLRLAHIRETKDIDERNSLMMKLNVR